MSTPPEQPSAEQVPAAQRELEASFRDWQARLARMQAATARALDSGEVTEQDLKSIKASDIGVTMGPPLTEEQFRELRRTRQVRVLKTGAKNF